ncbi:maltase-glucoamylase isoform X1 [Patella vulgata]|uniref:maltase-glucoamylase isoform X1 n=1 Tax=Patella vulgata TaxID=6465 RepID=UPI0024A86C7B|nr:maltase-glucoamylase isoform X1 [Patella vulgata]
MHSVYFRSHFKGESMKSKIIFIIIAVIAVFICVQVYFVFLADSPKRIAVDGGQPVNIGPFIDCHPEKYPDKTTCDLRGCVWRKSNDDNSPQCVYSIGHGYLVRGEITKTSNGLQAEVERIKTPKIYDSEIYDRLVVTVEYQTESRLRIKIVPKDVDRYVVPDEALNIRLPGKPPPASSRLYEVTLVKGTPQFGIIVTRKGDSTAVFSTDLPGMTYSDQFLQITTRLPSDNLYGFGEHNHSRFRHDMNWKTWSIFPRRIGREKSVNLYSAHPVYMNLENDGRGSVVLLKNTNAMEVVLQPSPNPAITYRVIGGILDFYIFMGPSPEQAVQQYIQAIGEPVMPPYWALGFHVCRFGYNDVNDVEAVIKRTRAAGLPYDAQWVDIEYKYEFVDFTLNKKLWGDLPKVIEDLHGHNQKFILTIDPGSLANRKKIKKVKLNSPGYNVYDDGVLQDVFIKNESNQIVLAKYWPGMAATPDFTNPKTQGWWLKNMEYLYNDENIKYDALWLDKNEVSPRDSMKCSRNKWNNPPYVPDVGGSSEDSILNKNTICMDLKQHWGRHYDSRALYGHGQSILTYNGLLHQFPRKRPWVMTRSSFVGTGKYATKWMGDNRSTWADILWSVISIVEFSMFGFAMNGADICGFGYAAEYELCLRWHQLGAFYPFSRNHNTKKKRPQDPASWDQRFVDIVKPVLMTRYRLLPYLYTLMYKAHEEGHMVMKALLFEFPADRNTWSIDRQFLLGPALLISPALEPNQTVVEAYFPKARWYEYNQGSEIIPSARTHKLYTPLEVVNLHIRGGHVIPVQQPSTTTYQSRQNPMGIIIALDENHLANGELFLDDGESLETHKNIKSTIVQFSMSKTGELVIKYMVNNYTGADYLYIKTIEIYGLNKIPVDVRVNDASVDRPNIIMLNKLIQIQNLNIKITDTTIITWRT